MIKRVLQDILKQKPLYTLYQCIMIRPKMLFRDPGSRAMPKISQLFQEAEANLRNAEMAVQSESGKTILREAIHDLMDQIFNMIKLCLVS